MFAERPDKRSWRTKGGGARERKRGEEEGRGKSNSYNRLHSPNKKYYLNNYMYMIGCQNNETYYTIQNNHTSLR
jgi:hypothetical protein